MSVSLLYLLEMKLTIYLYWEKKLYGIEEELPTKNLTKLIDLAMLFGLDEIHKHY
jgi:hypothetical protein